MSRTYFVPSCDDEIIHEVKKSRFIACSRRVTQRDEAMAFLMEIKLKYPDARHYCWAYQIGDPQSASSAAMNDDGEPSGTAGRPILNVVKHKKIADVMVIVVRYFGGVKLGAGGLTRAYSTATQNLLSSIELTEYVPLRELVVSLMFSQENQLRHWLDTHNAQWVATEYQADAVIATVCLPVFIYDEFVNLCNSLTIKIDSDV